MRKRIQCYWVFLILLTWSCSNTGQVEKPENLISEEQMENILFDATLMEAINNSTDRNLELELLLGKPYLYLKYGVDSLQLVESEQYYAKNPRVYLRIYNNVLKRVDKAKDSLNDLDKKSKAVQK